MPFTLTPRYRALAIGSAAAAVLAGAFALGATEGSAAPSSAGQNSSVGQSSAGQHPSAAQADAAVSSTAAGAARITVTGTGTVNGTPNQLLLSMGVQVNGSSVGSALQQANQAANRVMGALRARGVAAADIQTSGLYIQPNYRDGSQVPDGYAVSESLTATLRDLGTAGADINAAVQAGGNAVTINGVSLDLTDTSGLLARARARAVADARVKAAQYTGALGQPLGPVLSITDQAPPQYPIYAAAGAAAPRASSVPISPGTQQLSVSVTVIFAM